MSRTGTIFPHQISDNSCNINSKSAFVWNAYFVTYYIRTNLPMLPVRILPHREQMSKELIIIVKNNLLASIQGSLSFTVEQCYAESVVCWLDQKCLRGMLLNLQGRCLLIR